jgi:hypothetical protein
MSDELKVMIKEIKKRVIDRTSTVTAITIAKTDPEKQMTVFTEFLNKYNSELKKSASEGKYVAQMMKDFDGMKLSDIRFVIEKSYDRYNKIISLMAKYSENFNEEEIKKYNDKLTILNDVLAFMIQNSLGDYKDVEASD